MQNKCLTGFARSGKDTAAKVLAELLEMETYALAQPIKDIMCALFNWDEEHRDGSYKEINLTYTVTPDTLEYAAEVYESYGLQSFEEFHDCWEKLITLFNLELDEDVGVYHTIISPRVAFQLFGTEWGRTINDNIWLDIAPKNNAVITDIRFDNEAEYFINLNADIIEITRPGFRPVTNGHASESGVSEALIDYSIINNSSKDNFIDKVRELAATL